MTIWRLGKKGSRINSEKKTHIAKRRDESNNKYVVDQLVGLKKFRKKLHYRFLWYEYTSKDDKIVPEINIEQHFISYYLDIQKKMATKYKEKYE